MKSAEVKVLLLISLRYYILMYRIQEAKKFKFLFHVCVKFRLAC